MQEALEEELGVEARIKWPNDILLNGKKVAGHLIDEIGRQIVLGVGMNFTNKLDPTLVKEATTIQAETGLTVNHHAFINPLLSSIERWIEKLERDPREVRIRCLDVCASLGKQAEVRVEHGLLQGFVTDIDEFGRLVLETEHGELRVCSGTLPQPDIDPDRSDLFYY